MTQRIVMVLGAIVFAMSVLTACGGQPAEGNPATGPDPKAGGGSPTRGDRADVEGMLPASPEAAPDAAAAMSGQTQTTDPGTGMPRWPVVVVGILMVAVLGIMGVLWQQRTARRSTDHR